MFGPAYPDLLAVDDIVITLAPGEGFDRGGVGPGHWLSDPECLQAQGPIGDFRKVARLLLR